MRLSLIAMSGSGKSYWAGQLAGAGFKCFSCDEMIASKLFDELVQPDGSLLPMAKWMGLPYQPGYLERESKYLAYEKQVLEEIFKIIENNYYDSEKYIVIDTTGSVIYTGADILNKLRTWKRRRKSRIKCIELIWRGRGRFCGRANSAKNRMRPTKKP